MSHPTPAHALIRQVAKQLAERVRPVSSSHGAARAQAAARRTPEHEVPRGRT